MARKNVESTEDLAERRHREGLWFSAYTGQMVLLWQQVTYVQLTAIGSFTGWYVTIANRPAVACGALYIGMVVQFALVFLIRRHAQILEEFSIKLADNHLISQDRSLYQMAGLSAHAIAKLVAGLFIISNNFVVIYTVWTASESFYETARPLIINIHVVFIIIVATAYKWLISAFFGLSNYKHGPIL